MADPIDFSTATLVSVIDSDLLNLIRSTAVQSTFKKGQLIERRDAPATHISLIRSGQVRLGIDGIDGSRFNMSILGEGNTFGETSLFLNEPIRHDAHAETKVVLDRLSHSSVEELSNRSPAFSRAMLTIAYARFRSALDYMTDAKKQPLEVRAAKIILDIYQNSSSDTEIHCKQVDLAHALNVSRVSIGKALSLLKQKKLIEVGYCKLIIPSSDKLTTFVEQQSYS